MCAVLWENREASKKTSNYCHCVHDFWQTSQYPVVFMVSRMFYTTFHFISNLTRSQGLTATARFWRDTNASSGMGSNCCKEKTQMKCFEFCLLGCISMHTEIFGWIIIIIKLLFCGLLRPLQVPACQKELLQLRTLHQSRTPRCQNPPDVVKKKEKKMLLKCIHHKCY